MRHVHRARVTPDDVGQRVSVRHRLSDDTVTDTVGRLLRWTHDELVVIDRNEHTHEIAAARVLASRTIPEHPRLPPEPHEER